MKTETLSYHGFRYPPEIISHAVWLYHRFTLSLRDVEELLAERGIEVTYESIRQWCHRFGPKYARNLKRRCSRSGDTWYLDEVFVKSGANYITYGEPLTRMEIQSISSFRNAAINPQHGVSSGNC